MKFFTAIALLFFANTSHASLFSCEDVVRFAVAAKIQEVGKGEKVSAVTALESPFSTLRLYSVVATMSYEDGMAGIPYASHWLVVAKDIGGTAGCIGAEVFHDITAL